MTTSFPTDDAFQNALNREDELGRVIRAHLHIENLVDRLLLLKFSKPEVFQKMRLEFSARVMLLEAFGYGRMLTMPLAAIGNLRNDFAHKVDFALTSERMEGLYNSFDVEGKEIIQQSYRRTRTQMPETNAPHTMKSLKPQDRFTFYAVSIHAMLVICLKEQTAGRPQAPHRT
jgi:hypothetical protein